MLIWLTEVNELSREVSFFIGYPSVRRTRGRTEGTRRGEKFEGARLERWDTRGSSKKKTEGERTSAWKGRESEGKGWREKESVSEGITR